MDDMSRRHFLGSPLPRLLVSTGDWVFQVEPAPWVPMTKSASLHL